MALDNTLLFYIISTSSGVIGLVLGLVYKSKCKVVSCCCLRIERDIDAEERIDEMELGQAKKNNSNVIDYDNNITNNITGNAMKCPYCNNINSRCFNNDSNYYNNKRSIDNSNNSRSSNLNTRCIDNSNGRYSVNSNTTNNNGEIDNSNNSRYRDRANSYNSYNTNNNGDIDNSNNSRYSEMDNSVNTNNDESIDDSIDQSTIVLQANDNFKLVLYNLYGNGNNDRVK
jgi:hypothetical protein